MVTAHHMEVLTALHRALGRRPPVIPPMATEEARCFEGPVEGGEGMYPVKPNRRRYYIPADGGGGVLRRLTVEVIDRGRFEIMVKSAILPAPVWIQVPHNGFEVGDRVIIERREHGAGLLYRYVRKEEA